MPYVRISLLRGKKTSYLNALSESLHQALVESFAVPLADRFQIIQQLAPEEFMFDRHYLCGPRSDDFVLISICAGRPRDTSTKQAFYCRLVELLAKSPGIRSQDVMVVINTTALDEWSFGDGVVTLLADQLSIPGGFDMNRDACS